MNIERYRNLHHCLWRFLWPTRSPTSNCGYYRLATHGDTKTSCV